jgi:hypothetical protein
MTRPARSTLADLVLSLIALSGCGHQDLEGIAPESIESSYLQARLPQAGCRERDEACCAEHAGAARAAASAGETARAAQLWEGVALACPARRSEAGAAVLAASRLGPGLAGSDGHTINVSYRTRLSPAIRLFWVATDVDARLLPVAVPGAPTSRHLRVEVQAIRFAAGRPGPLLTVTHELDVPFGERTAVTVEIVETDPARQPAEPLAIRTQVDQLPAPRSSPPPGPRPKQPGPLLEKARVLHIDSPRAPPEFGAMLQGVRPALRVCLDREGRVDTVRLLEQAHPRLAAAVLDMLRDSRNEPYRVGDLAVPSCETRPRS